MELEKWENAAKLDQQLFCSLYDRKLEFCLPDSLNKMKTIIAFGFFEFPKIEENSCNLQEVDSIYTCYSEEEKTIVDSVVEAICADGHGEQIVYLRNTRLLCKIEGSSAMVTNDANNVCENTMSECVYAFSFNGAQFKFIDICSRVYKDWDDFTGNNNLPPCKYCYPENGIHAVKSKILFAYSPNSSFWHKVTTSTDLITNIGGVGSGVGCLIITNPVGVSAAVGVGITVSAYSVVRSMYGLFDRVCHKQSIGVYDAESRNYWFNVVSAALTVGTSSAVANSTRLVQKYGTTAIKGIMTLNGVTVAIDIAAVGNSLYNLFVKYQTGKTITYTDALYLSVQIMFLSGAIVNAKQIHSEMSNLSTGNVGKVLTKSQKRNALKKKSLAKAKQDPNYVKPPKPPKNKNEAIKSPRVRAREPTATNTAPNKRVPIFTNCNQINGAVKSSGVKTRESDLARAIPDVQSSVFMNYLQDCPRLVFSILKYYYQPGEYIWQHFVAIANNFQKFNSSELDLERFLITTSGHLQNLYFILKDELSKLKPLLSNVKLFASESDEEGVCFGLDNAVTEINNFEAEINENNDRVDDAVKTVYVVDESVVRKRLSEMLRQFTFIIHNLFVIYNNQRVISEYQMSKIYVETLIDTIDVILLNLTEDGEQYANDIAKYGLLIAALIKSKKNDELFEDIVSVLASTVEDAFHSNLEKLFLSHGAASTTATANSETTTDFMHVDRICQTIVETLSLFVKTDEIPMLHKPELVLLKELLVQMLLVHCFADVSSETASSVLEKLQKDPKCGNYYKSLTIRTNSSNMSVKLVNLEDAPDISSVQTTAKHKKLFEISCIYFYKLMESGFDIHGNDVGYIFNIIIDFVKSKILDTLIANYETYNSNLYIFNLLTDDLISRCISDDALLRECTEFCLTRLDSKKDILIWEDIINDIGMEVTWCYNLDNILDDSFLKKLAEKFDINLEDVHILRNKNENIITVTPKDNYICDVEMIVVCKISEETGGFIVGHKRTNKLDADSNGSDDSDDSDDNND